MFDDDICLCGNAIYCSQRNQCRRAEHKIGIHTYSNFYEYEKDRECKYFLKKIEKKEEKNYVK